MDMMGLALLALLTQQPTGTLREGPSEVPSVFSPTDAAVMGIHGFEDSHPDMRFRTLGIEARKQERFEQARANFRSAARYADKLSQAALAEMYWKGEGGPVDRALAYAWMDLAAERGTRWLLLIRERYWQALDPGERERAVREGQAIYAACGDAAAKPRLEHLLRVGRNSATGSRLGWIGNGLDIHNTDSLADIGAGRSPALVSADAYYADRYWKPEAYWEWQDQILRTAPREGSVDIGQLQTMPDAGR
jgi:hypothetical protein